MQELKVIGVESGALIAASDDGARFRIEIDEVLQSRIRQAHPEVHQGPKLSPREIQAHIRSGLSAEEVASLTGAAVDYIRRFEGPVLAERDHVVTSALSIPVHTAGDLDPADDQLTFGTAMRERLAKLDVHGERWASWKDEERGWIVKLEFTADTIDHDARWTFDVRRRVLQPINSEAITLSQQGELKDGLIPRLRAVGSDGEQSRFDSGAFTFDEPVVEVQHDTAPQLEPLPYGRPAPLAPQVSSPAVARAAIKRADEPTQPQGETADLLEALRRRRGERESATGELEPLFPAPAPAAPAQSAPPAAPTAPVAPTPVAPQPVPVSLNSEPQPSNPSAPVEKPAAAARSIWGGKVSGSNGSGRNNRKGRASMPSWDEIVFGARSDDDLA
ncbi:DUF3071 domain-containing protein [Agromyces protaetiae]|uniref:DUF3071 domain-containing protein n=1 Tax=Agromyces protaetiae TaxID=2509455 RepID=A0A4P6FGC6_9MICO|nr:septation protein SepH [Agromyces protaetiae]QAY74985.1 DUF3071 domain-containing protein [Agromyces protaetiae]